MQEMMKIKRKKVGRLLILILHTARYCDILKPGLLSLPVADGGSSWNRDGEGLGGGGGRGK